MKWIILGLKTFSLVWAVIYQMEGDFQKATYFMALACFGGITYLIYKDL